MKVRLSLLCILFSCSVFTVEAQSFSSYLSKFKVWKGKNIDKTIFMGVNFSSLKGDKRLDPASASAFLPRWSQASDDVVMDTYAPAYIIKKPHFIAAFIYHQSTNRTDPNASFYSFEMVTYTKTGKILDNATVVMGMDAWVHDIKGTVAPLVIEEIKKTNLKNDFVNVDVEGVGDAIRYSISNNGTITKKELPSLALAKSVTHPAVKSKRVSFRNYLKLFATWKSASINDSLSTANVKNYMDDNCVQRYIPKDLDCKCELKSLHYAPQYIINGTNYIITFLLKVCDKPSDDYWPYNDLVMITYSKDGDVIDHKIIARSGDVWSYQIGGALAPLNINVSQRYHVITSGKSATDGFTKSINTQYSIDEKGKISSFN